MQHQKVLIHQKNGASHNTCSNNLNVIRNVRRCVWKVTGLCTLHEKLLLQRKEHCFAFKMSQFLMVSKTKFQHSVTTTFFFARFSVKAFFLWPFCENLIKLWIFGFFSLVWRMSVEQRINLKFPVRLSWKNSNWSTKVASRSLCWWHNVKSSSFWVAQEIQRGKRGGGRLEVDHRSGRPSTSRTEENVQRVRKGAERSPSYC